VLLEERRLAEAAELAVGRRRNLGLLVVLTYDADPLVAWRAVEALGVAGARLADEDLPAGRELLRRLMWLITEESGAICWRAPEAMAEIVVRRPEAYGAYAPIVAHLLLESAEEDLDHFRPGILWAIGRLGPLVGDVAGDLLSPLVEALEHADPQVRGMAVRALAGVGHRSALRDRPALRTDTASVEVYVGGALERTTVARLTGTALEGGVATP